MSRFDSRQSGITSASTPSSVIPGCLIMNLYHEERYLLGLLAGHRPLSELFPFDSLTPQLLRMIRVLWRKKPEVPEDQPADLERSSGGRKILRGGILKDIKEWSGKEDTETPADKPTEPQTTRAGQLSITAV